MGPPLMPFGPLIGLPRISGLMYPMYEAPIGFPSAPLNINEINSPQILQQLVSNCWLF